MEDLAAWAKMTYGFVSGALMMLLMEGRRGR